MEARRQGKTDRLIRSLPSDPDKKIIWIVYNSDMIASARKRLVDVWGEHYVNRNVEVVSRTNSSKFNGHIYFDPWFYSHLSNGYT